MQVELGDFAPDLDPTVAGIRGERIPDASQAVLTDANWVYATSGGWANMPMPVRISPALPGKCMGAFACEIGGTFLAVLGTANQLYFFENGLLVNQNLTLANSRNRWYFTVYGTDLLACNGSDPVQVSPDGGQFVKLAGNPPIASIVEATDFSLFLIPPFSNQAWFTFNDELWTPAIETETALLTLSSTPGIIRAAKALRSGINFFKQNSFFNAQFSGPPLFWNITKVSDKVGTWGADSVVTHDTMQFFVGPDNFYQTDGFGVQPIPNNLRKWFFNTQLDKVNAGNMCGVDDVPRQQIVWWYPSLAANPAGSLDSYVSYSYLTGKWSHGGLVLDLPVAGLLSSTQAWTWAKFQNTYVRWSNVPSVVYGDPMFSGTRDLVGAIVDSEHKLASLTGAYQGSLPAFITTGDFGDKRNIYRINRARAGFLNYPQNPPLASPAKMSVFSTYVAGNPYTLRKGLVDISPVGYFDFVTSDRLQRLKLGWYADGELADLEVDLSYAGKQ
jgi:hypothetical protein